MKLIITGATGFVASEVLRQALLLPSITSIVAVARSPISAPEGTPNSSKLRSIVVPDYGTWSEDVKKEIAGADACIWTVAITPFKSRSMPFETVRKVCQEWTLAGLNAMVDSSPNQPFRFLYMSGAASSKADDKNNSWTPKYMAQYSLMRGETESQVLALAAKKEFQGCVAKPGFITGQGGILRGIAGTAMSLTGVVETIHVKEVAAAMLQEVVHGLDNEVLTNKDMVKSGKEVLESIQKE